MYSGIRTRRPVADSSGHSSRAIVWLTTATWGVPALSESDHTRPRTSGIFITAKYWALIRWRSGVSPPVLSRPGTSTTDRSPDRGGIPLLVASATDSLGARLQFDPVGAHRTWRGRAIP